MSEYTLVLTIQVPPSVVRHLGTPQAIQGFLLDQGIWPVTATQRRWAIDPLTHGYVIDLELGIEMDDVTPA